MGLHVSAATLHHTGHLAIYWVKAEFGLGSTGGGLLDVQFLWVGELQGLQESGLTLHQV